MWPNASWSQASTDTSQPLPELTQPPTASRPCPKWRAAQFVKAVPDRAQQPVRERALRDGKLLYVAVPRLAAEMPFFVLDPTDLTAAPAEAAPRKHAAHHARKIAVEDMRRVDIVVCGSGTNPMSGLV